MFQMMIFRKEVAEGWLSVYMDNIAIHSKRRPLETEEQHRQQHKLYVHHVLDKLERHDLYLKPEKCAFEKDEIDYLGVIIGNSIVKMDPSKLKGVADWPKPKTPTEIRQFRSQAIIGTSFPNIPKSHDHFWTLQRKISCGNGKNVNNGHSKN